MALTDNLVAHYLLNNNADDCVGTYDGAVSGTVDFTGDHLDPLSGSVTIPDSSASSCSYWKDTGSGFDFTYTTTIPTSLATDNYSNLRMYSDTKDAAFQSELEAEGYYPKPLPLPTTDGLIAHYPLTGTARDSTGNYDGTEPSIAYVDDAEKGSVLASGGITSANSIVVNNLYLTHFNDFTISGWFKFSAAALTKRHAPGIGNQDNTNSSSNYAIGQWFDFEGSSYLVASALGYGGVGDIGYVAFDTKPTTDEWNHIAVQYKFNDYGKIYINGQLKKTGATRYTSKPTDTARFYIGGWGNHSTTWSGSVNVSSARVYDRFLTAAEITDIYNYEKNFHSIDVDSGLIAYYPLANNSSDNYFNKYDAPDDAGVTYDGIEATLPVGDNIAFPSAAGFVEAYYVKDGLLLTTTIEADLNALTDCVLSGVRKYNRNLTLEQIAVIRSSSFLHSPWVISLDSQTANADNFKHTYRTNKNDVGLLYGVVSSTEHEPFQAKYEFTNVSVATEADVLITHSLISDGDNLVLVKDDGTIVEIVANNVSPAINVAVFGNIGSTLTLSEENKKVTRSGSNSWTNATVYSKYKIEEGQDYEFTFTSDSNEYIMVGINTSNTFQSDYSGSSGSGGYSYYMSNGYKYLNGSSSGYGSSPVSGDSIKIKYTTSTGTLEFFRNGVSQGVAVTLTPGTKVYFAMTLHVSGQTVASLSSYKMNTITHTKGEVPLKVYTVDARASFSISGGYMDAIGIPSYTYENEILKDTRSYKDLVHDTGSLTISPRITLKSIGDKIIELTGTMTGTTEGFALYLISYPFEKSSPVKWISSPLIKSGFAAIIGHDFLLDFIDTECKISEFSYNADALGPVLSYVEDEYIEDGYDNLEDAEAEEVYLRPHGKIFQDPVLMSFVNRGYTRNDICDPHKGGDYAEEMFPASRSVASSLLRGANTGIFGSRIRLGDIVCAPNMNIIKVVYQKYNMTGSFTE